MTAEHVLKDGRTLLLRAPTIGDAELLMGYPKIVGSETDFLLCGGNGIDGLTLEGERKWIQDALDAPNTALFLGFVGGELAALFEVRGQKPARVSHNASIALSVKRAYWHLGIGSAAMRTMIDFAKGTGVLRTLSLGVREGNDRAIALYTRFGFVEIGRHRGRINVRGTYYDELLMDLPLIGG